MGAPLIYDGIDLQYPDTLKLKQVQILFRHGERTAIYNHRNIKQWERWGFPIFWPLCNSSRSSRVGVIDAVKREVGTFEYEREIETPYITAQKKKTKLFENADKKGICLEGELTDLGRLSGFRLGQQIRQLYVDKLAFLPRNFTDPADFYLRTTSIIRSRETLQHLFAGVYPPANFLALPKIFERFPFEENLYPTTFNCSRLKELRQQFVDHYANIWDPKLVAPSEALRQVLSSPTTQITVDGPKDEAWGIIDSYVAATAAGIQTPKAFENRDAVNLVGRAALESEFNGYEQNNELQKLGMGRFFGEVLDRMTVGDPVTTSNDTGITELTGKPNVVKKIPKLALYAAHDSSIGTILSTLGVFTDKKWIGFTSHIVFEQFETASLAKIFQFKTEYVRVKYNGKPVILPVCKPAGKHLDGDETLCTMSAFRDLVKSVSPTDWHKECVANLGHRAPELVTGELEPEPI
ncbi:histidine phosphatase superfamily [Lipomyces japonicus]|uniref:histidine phosphatase superfamily n=1 Tax=Lipomyces japonicus TaxID=56871 RepID=UPI0034CF6BB8